MHIIKNITSLKRDENLAILSDLQILDINLFQSKYP